VAYIQATKLEISLEKILAFCGVEKWLNSELLPRFCLNSNKRVRTGVKPMFFTGEKNAKQIYSGGEGA
jgi:hypothetical protein